MFVESLFNADFVNQAIGGVMVIGYLIKLNLYGCTESTINTSVIGTDYYEIFTQVTIGNKQFNILSKTLSVQPALLMITQSKWTSLL